LGGFSGGWQDGQDEVPASITGRKSFTSYQSC
jgi:hypothetical protein